LAETIESDFGSSKIGNQTSIGDVGFIALQLGFGITFDAKRIDNGNYLTGVVQKWATASPYEPVASRQA